MMVKRQLASIAKRRIASRTFDAIATVQDPAGIGEHLRSPSRYLACTSFCHFQIVGRAWVGTDGRGRTGELSFCN
jgi:hypothetical protein